METKFTKGEWKVSSKGEYLEIIADGTEFICDLGEECVAFEEEYANAKLIAAAPNLLEALLYGHEISSKIQYPTNEELKMFTRMAALAIKKATE